MRKLTLLGVFSFVSCVAGVAFAEGGGNQGPTRINFDDRLIKGQTTKVGSVYIFDRKQSDNPSLVSKKRSVRYRIIRTVFEES